MKKKTARCEPMLNLKLMRVRKGFTLVELARKAGLNYNTISQYENGLHAPRMENLQLIAKALGCEVKDII